MKPMQMSSTHILSIYVKFTILVHFWTLENALLKVLFSLLGASASSFYKRVCCVFIEHNISFGLEWQSTKKAIQILYK